jgi:hypothetical protein
MGPRDHSSSICHQKRAGPAPSQASAELLVKIGVPTHKRLVDNLQSMRRGFDSQLSHSSSAAFRISPTLANGVSIRIAKAPAELQQHARPRTFTNRWVGMYEDRGSR